MAKSVGLHMVDCLLEVSWRQVYYRLFFLFRSETDRLMEDRRTRRLYVGFQTGDSVRGDSKHIGENCHKEFVN